MKVTERFSGILTLATLCYFLAMFTIVLAPLLLTDADEPMVVDIHGNKVKVPPYTDQEKAGKDVYQTQVCWHCHSQFVRPVMDETWRFGPVSQAGESAIDVPHLFGTRRIGPDLAREGWQRVDDWQIAHLFDPRSTVSLSVMPSFPWLFRDNPVRGEVTDLIALLDSDGDGVVSPKFDHEAYGGKSHWPAEALEWIRSGRLDNSGVLAPEYRQKEDGSDFRPGADGKVPYRDRWTAVPGGDGLLTDHDMRPLPKQTALDLVAYLQRLGIAIGPWLQQPDVGTPVRMGRPPMLGVTVKWKTESGEERESSVPDGQMPLRNREARRYGVAWRDADEATRSATIDARREYEVLRPAWEAKNPAWKERLAKGKELFDTHCASCHGPEGRGNGPGAQHFLIRPRDFTMATYRYRSTQAGNMPLDGDLYRSIARGLWGTAMPPWHFLAEHQIWLLVDYVKSLAERTAGSAKPFDLQRLALEIPPIPSMRDEKARATRAKRGRALYFAMQCFNCHGSEGRGDGPGWNTTEKDGGGLLRPRDLKKRDERDIPTLRMRGGATHHDIYRTLMTGIGGTQMKSSFQDFKTAWDAADRLDQLVAAKAPEAEIAAARKSARLLLQVPTGEKLPGVVEDKDEKGNTIEYLERVNRDDDWNLVIYVMELLGVPVQFGR
jgi:cytochrome c oxidase cbb3-type subunit 2/cytochrome c oxidase cbb3-type subunit I/II